MSEFFSRPSQASRASVSSPVGAIVSAPSSPGSSWLECDGSVLLQADYPDLFAEVGLIQDLFPSTAYPATTALTRTAALWADSIFVQGGASGALRVSVNDGTNWTDATAGSTTVRHFAYSSTLDLWVAISDTGGLATASDPTGTWTARTSGTSNHLYGGWWSATLSLFVVVGASGTILTSANGTDWDIRTSGTAVTLHDVESHLGLFVAVGDSGTILTSANGTDWIARTSGTTEALNNVVYGTEWVVMGSTQSVILSTDGITWQLCPAIGASVAAIARTVLHWGGGIYYCCFPPMLFSPRSGLVYTAPSWTANARTSCALSPTRIVESRALGDAFGVVIERYRYPYNTSTQFRLPQQSIPLSDVLRRWIKAE
jgi:hypothetical protein